MLACLQVGHYRIKVCYKIVAQIDLSDVFENMQFDYGKLSQLPVWLVVQKTTTFLLIIRLFGPISLSAITSLFVAH